MLTPCQGNQLRRDLNSVIANGKNWNVPVIFGAVLRYITAPIIGMLFSMAYPLFYENRADPLHIAGFGFMHLSMVASFVGLFLPRWFNVFVPRNRIRDGYYPVAPAVILKRANAENDLADGVSDEETVIPSDRDSDEKLDASVKRSSSDKVDDEEKGLPPQRSSFDRLPGETNDMAMPGQSPADPAQR